MPVAKSYKDRPILCDPYVKSGRKYVKIRMKSGIEKEVRFYSDFEYAKMYPDEKVDRTKDPYYKPQKYTLGFEKGYITIFKNIKPENEEWFRQSICRFARFWGWYVPSTMEIPKDLPSGVIPVRLYWEPIGNEEDWLVEDSKVIKYVQSVLYAATNSKRQGNIGDRLERKLTVVDRSSYDTQYGKTVTHIMIDENENYYSWKTTAKDWELDTVHYIKGTVKEYTTYKGSETTVLTRCIEI